MRYQDQTKFESFRLGHERVEDRDSFFFDDVFLTSGRSRHKRPGHTAH
ncbi:unnamed protein product [Rhodiola kirilowii]